MIVCTRKRWTRRFEESLETGNGRRFLFERQWPRGVCKEIRIVSVRRSGALGLNSLSRGCEVELALQIRVPLRLTWDPWTAGYRNTRVGSPADRDAPGGTPSVQTAALSSPYGRRVLFGARFESCCREHSQRVVAAIGAETPRQITIAGFASTARPRRVGARRLPSSYGFQVWPERPDLIDSGVAVTPVKRMLQRRTRRVHQQV
jgi:hypothetical protein